MNEVVYNIKMLLGFVIIVSFVLFWYIKLEYETQFHGNDFIGLEENFEISTGTIIPEARNIIFLQPNFIAPSEYWCLQDIPEICEWSKKYSLTCLQILKEKGTWFYNGAYFLPSDKNCRGN